MLGDYMKVEIIYRIQPSIYALFGGGGQLGQAKPSGVQEKNT